MTSQESNSNHFRVPKVLYENRYCNQEGFSVLVCGGKDKKYIRQVFGLKVPNFEVSEFPSMMFENYNLILVTIKSSIIAIGDTCILNNNIDKSVSIEIYSKKSKIWTHQYVGFDERDCYCVCSFMSELYVIGGCLREDDVPLDSCHCYNINCNTWYQIANLNEERYSASCTVFEGKIVVTGGFNYDHSIVKSAETYDYYENKWCSFPDMIENRVYHTTVSMGNKLFVIGGFLSRRCEVFDSHSRQFTEMKSHLKVPNMRSKNFKAVGIGYYIVVFHSLSSDDETTITMYSVCENKWSTIKCDFTKNLFDYSIVKFYI